MLIKLEVPSQSESQTESLNTLKLSSGWKLKIFLGDFGRKLSYYQTRDLSKVVLKPYTAGVSWPGCISDDEIIKFFVLGGREFTKGSKQS